MNITKLNVAVFTATSTSLITCGIFSCFPHDFNLHDVVYGMKPLLKAALAISAAVLVIDTIYFVISLGGGSKFQAFGKLSVRALVSLMVLSAIYRSILLGFEVTHYNGVIWGYLWGANISGILLSWSASMWMICVAMILVRSAKTSEATTP